MPQASRSSARWHPARLISALPEGTGAIGTGLIVLGVTTYLFLVVSARRIGVNEYSSLSVLWAFSLVVGPGVFFPLEQELGRTLAARRTAGDGAAPVVGAAAVAGLVMLAILAATILLAARPMLDRFFDGDVVLLVSLLLGLGAAWVQYLAKGVLLGAGRFPAYGGLLAIEGSARFAGCGILALAGVRTAGAYGICVALAPLVSSVAAVGSLGFARQPGSSVERRRIYVAIAILVAGSLLSQLLVNLGPALVKAFASSTEKAVAGRFLSCLVITRVPLFLFAAVEASALPTFAEQAAAGRRAEFRGSVTRLGGFVVAIALAGVAGAAVLGPFAVRVLYGADFDLGTVHLVYLAGASGAYMLALILNGALVALSSHDRAALGWLAGLAALAAVVAAGGGALQRVERGLLTGSLVTDAAMLVFLLRVVARWPDGTPHKAVQIRSAVVMEV